MNKNYYDDDYCQTNRDKSRFPRKIKGWCDGCDTTMVEEGKKCPNCGHRQGRPVKRLKG